MRLPRPRPILAQCLLTAIAVALTACTSAALHRPESIDEKPGYTLTFIEFDDHGEPWAPEQLEGTIQVIDEIHNTDKRAVVLLFVHGWHNDASQRDERKKDNNVEGFQRLLTTTRELIDRTGDGEDVELVGVYLGWRGRSTDNTLLKPGGLTQREYEDIKRHVGLGKQIITSVRWLEDAVDVIFYHHEKWDGTGYPEGLSGDSIPLLARVFCVADVFDALTSERPYKHAMSYSEAVTTMNSEKNLRFDPHLIDEFFKVSEQAYSSIASQDSHSLEDTVLAGINRYFQFSPTIDDLRDAFGSIARREQS